MSFLKKEYVRKQLIVAICVYVGKMVLCLTMVYPDQWLLSDPEKTPLQYPLTAEDRLLIELTFYSGIWIGAGIFGFLSNTSGRKPCFFLSGSFCFCAFLLLARMKTIGVLYAAKFIAGLGSGIVYVSILVYLGEIASTNIRGLILTSIHIFGFLQTWLDIFVYDMPFYSMSYYGLAISAVFIMAMFFIPESPVFFTLKGSNEHLEKSLTSLGRDKELAPMLSTKLELKSLKKTHKDNWLEIFKVRSNRNALFIILILNILQNLSGSMGVLYFTPTIIYPHEVVTAKFASIVMNISCGGGVLFSLCLVEKIGRKKLLMISTASCALSLAILSTFSLINIWIPSQNAWIYVMLIVLGNYFFSASMGFSTIPETLIGEMFTPNVRSTGSALVIILSTLLEYFIILALHFILLINVSNLHVEIVFVVYCLTNVIAFFFILFFVPETKGLTLNEVNEMLSSKKLLRCSFGAGTTQLQNVS